MDCASKMLIKPLHVARFLNVPPSVVFELAAKGEIKSVKVGRTLRFPYKPLHDDFLAGAFKNLKNGGSHDL
jgi:excisionase family DNA binding protein